MLARTGGEIDGRVYRGFGNPKRRNTSVNGRCYPASLQVNGGPVFDSGGAWAGYVAFDTPGLTLEQLEAVSRYYYGLGYAWFCPTMVTASPEAYRTNLPVFRAAREHVWGKGVLPPHLEGPFLAPECIGAHNPALRRDPTVEFAASLLEWSNGFVGWITMASERPGAVETIRYLTSHGISVSLGHQNPTVENILAGIEAGATGFTHVLNAATRDKIGAKDLRMIAQFADRRTYSMIIPDAIHVPEYAVKLMTDSKGPDKVIFVADESPLIGAPVPTTSELWGRTFEVRLDEAGRVRSYDLSGSCTSLIECMNIAVGWGIPRDTVERAVTENAAAFLKPALSRLGISLDQAPGHSGGVAFSDGKYVPVQ
jgi:N-acetylglucosamine-6-phosphate deacetylase